jgi:hypothetical protein
MGRKREWTEIFVWDRVRLRIRVETERGAVIDMMVQLELNDEGWQPVIRYNFAHGKPHMDRMHKDGRKEKIWLEAKNLGDILSYAEVDVRSNWRKHLKECGYYETE